MRVQGICGYGPFQSKYEVLQIALCGFENGKATLTAEKCLQPQHARLPIMLCCMKSFFTSHIHPLDSSSPNLVRNEVFLTPALQLILQRAASLTNKDKEAGRPSHCTLSSTGAPEAGFVR